MRVTYCCSYVAITLFSNYSIPGWILECSKYSWFWINICHNFLPVFSVCIVTHGYLHFMNDKLVTILYMYKGNY